MANKTGLESNGNAIDRGNDSVGAEHSAINSKTIESASNEAEGIESGDTDYYAPSEDEEEAASDFAESEGECDEEEVEEIIEVIFG